MNFCRVLASVSIQQVDSFGDLLQVYAELDDRLLQEFPAFLEERGNNAEMGAYLLGLVNDKEEREYRSWLSNVHNFLKK